VLSGPVPSELATTAKLSSPTAIDVHRLQSHRIEGVREHLLPKLH
jgi:hypothetical protein